MEISLTTIYVALGILSTLGGFVVTIWVMSSKVGAFKAKDDLIEKRLTDIETELKNEDGLRRKIDERMDERFSSLDRRVQGLESKVIGFEARVDTKMDVLKESLTEIKKMVMDRMNTT